LYIWKQVYRRKPVSGIGSKLMVEKKKAYGPGKEKNK
jgi:hypothetical protein